MKKRSLLKSADLFVLPSGYEGFGIVLLEAMTCYQPVVASDVGGVPYVVENGKTELLFKSGDVNDLADKVIFLLKNKELRERMGRAGYEKAKEFSWDNIAGRIVKLYRKILS